MCIMKPFNAGTKQISVVILQLVMINYHMDWLHSNMNKTMVIATGITYIIKCCKSTSSKDLG